MIDYNACLDELEKIAEDDNYVTKARLKRIAIVAPLVGLGYGAGHVGGRLLGRALREHGILHKIPPKALAMVAGTGGAALSGFIAAKLRKKIDRYVHEGK